MGSSISALALIPKLKLFIAFSQTVVVLPTVYNVHLPPKYYMWTSFLDIFKFDWSSIAIPGSCLHGGFLDWLLLNGIGPFVLIVALFLFRFLGGVVAVWWMRRVKGKEETATHLVNGKPTSLFLQSALDALPLALFTCFCLCASTSASIFDTWSCTEYAYDSTVDPKIYHSFVRADLSLQCADIRGTATAYTSEYAKITSVAWVFVVLWPIAMPLLFLAVLWPSRIALLSRRSTRLVRATAFLHSEYEPMFFWWEPMFLIQRLIIVGFVQFIPREHEYGRLLCGVLVSITYLIILLTMQPYKRRDHDVLAIASQVTLVLVMMAAQTVHLYKELEDDFGPASASRVLGFRSQDDVVVTMIILNIAILVAYAALIAYQCLSRHHMHQLLLESTNEMPELTFGSSKTKFHLFLSHIWMTGQDQVAVIKRQLNLLLPGISVFLDVDNLQEIGNLEQYVAASQCVLIFLSKGYFFSTSCLRELRYAMEHRKPLLLVHESDVYKGGATLKDLRDDCDSKKIDAEYLFDGRWPIIGWHRVSAFQLLSLKLIAQAVIHCMKAYHGPQAPRVYIPNEISRQKLIFLKRVVLYVSAANPGATALAQELEAGFGGARMKLRYDEPENFQTMDEKSTSSVSSLAGKVADQVNHLCLASATSSVSSLAGKIADQVNHLCLASVTCATHMLLYLNVDTFVGEAGQTLAHQVRKARENALPIMLVHEVDTHQSPAGCHFDHFFRTTPQDLVDAGLYRTVAVACHPGPHRRVSLALIAKECGAVCMQNTSMAWQWWINKQTDRQTGKQTHSKASMQADR